jgi:hypothetical protein
MLAAHPFRVLAVSILFHKHPKAGIGASLLFQHAPGSAGFAPSQTFLNEIRRLTSGER